MAKVNISNVEVLDPEASFLSPFRFKITFECYEQLEEDLEWRIIYVSSAYNVALDQTLDSILVGPVPVGKHQFVFEAGPPSTDVIPLEDAVGVTVIIVACLYRDQEFIRVGYYVNNEYSDEQLRETPPERPQYERLSRHILADNPRVTRRGIDWGESKLAAAAAAAADALASEPAQDSMIPPQLQPQPPLQTPPPATSPSSVPASCGDQHLQHHQSQQQQQPPLRVTSVSPNGGAKENCDPAVAAS